VVCGNGCTVSGDFAALAAGRATVLRLQARVTVSDDGGSVVIFEKGGTDRQGDDDVGAAEPGGGARVGQAVQEHRGTSR
jgi:hypothetical protein